MSAMNSLTRGTGPLFTDPNVEHARAFFAAKPPKLTSKLMTATQAVSQFIHDGDYIASGGFGSNRISPILLHEIVRQRRNNLGVAGHTMTHDFQILCAGECIRREVESEGRRMRDPDLTNRNRIKAYLLIQDFMTANRIKLWSGRAGPGSP